MDREVVLCLTRGRESGCCWCPLLVLAAAHRAAAKGRNETMDGPSCLTCVHALQRLDSGRLYTYSVRRGQA